MSKQRPPAELVEVIRKAAFGRAEGAAPPTAAEAPHASLTAREHQVFMLLVQGRTVAEVAAELDVHSCTVSNHLARIRGKLGAATVADLVRYAIAEGLVESGV